MRCRTQVPHFFHRTYFVDLRSTPPRVSCEPANLRKATVVGIYMLPTDNRGTAISVTPLSVRRFRADEKYDGDALLILRMMLVKMRMISKTMELTPYLVPVIRENG